MAATYPNGIFVPTTYTDYTDVVLAADLNETNAEMVAVQSALGPDVATINSPSHVSGTVGSLLDSFNQQIGVLLQRTANPYATMLGGPNTGPYILASSNTLQALNATNPMRMVLQPNGGDMVIGPSSGIAVTVNGSISANQGISTTGALSTGSASIDGALYVTGITTFYNNVNAAGKTISAANASLSSALTTHGIVMAGGSIGFNNGVTIQSGGANIIDYLALNNVGFHDFQGHIRANAARQAYPGTTPSTIGWATANVILERPNDTNAELGTWSVWNGGTATTWLINHDELNIGWRPGDSRESPTIPISAPAFVITSSLGSKTDVEDLPHGLEQLKSLRPVQFSRPLPDVFAPRERDGNGKHGKVLAPEKRESLRKRIRPEETHSHGDAKRFRTRHHGLVAEEVERVLPEVVHYNKDGSPFGIDYGSLIPLLINSIKELSDKVDRLEKKQVKF